LDNYPKCSLKIEVILQKIEKVTRIEEFSRKNRDEKSTVNE
jgi:hypothetical protein